MTTIVAAETPPRWYVVRSNHRREALARASLRAEGVEVYLPMIAVANHKGETYGVPMFAGFLFTRLVPENWAWGGVFAARGVATVLGNGGKPTPIADLVIHRIRGREHNGYVEMIPAFARRFERKAGVEYQWKVGDKAVVKSGPLAGVEALFVEQVDGGRNSVLIRLLSDSPKLARIDPANLKTPSRT